MSASDRLTRAVILYIDNDQNFYEIALLNTRQELTDARGLDKNGRRRRVAETLENWISLYLDEVVKQNHPGNKLAEQLLSAAFEEIDFQAMAEHYIEKVLDEDEWLWKTMMGEE